MVLNVMYQYEYSARVTYTYFFRHPTISLKTVTKVACNVSITSQKGSAITVVFSICFTNVTAL